MSALPISSLHAALDEVLAAVAGLEPAVVLEAMQQVERFRNRLPLLDHALIARATLVGLAERQCFSTLEKLMVSALRISPAEAKRRTRAAAALSVGSPDLGGRVRLPELAAAQAAGEVSPDQVGLVERALWQVDVVDPGQRRAAEITLVDYARVFAPPELHRICARLVDDLDPDGARPPELVQHDLRGLCLTHRKDGMVAVDGRLTPAAGAQLQAVLGPLARPRQTTEPGPAGGQRPSPTPAAPPNASTTPSRTPAPGCSRAPTCPPPAAPRRPSSSP